MVQFTFLKVARHDPEVTSQVLHRVRAGVQTEFRFLVARVRPMAFEATVREDGADVAIEINLRRGRHRNDYRSEDDG